MPGIKCIARAFHLAGCTIMISAILACSHGPMFNGPPAEPTSAAQAKAAVQSYWWYVKFRIPWPEGQSPEWAMDVMLAHQVVEPVLKTHRNRIALWRFHRRANRDGTGHQFSFIFYADPETARRTQSAITADPNLIQLMADNRILTVTTDPVDMPKRPNIEDTSDPNWPESLQKSWPYYIMGVSRTWLALIDQHAPSARKGYADVDQMLVEYTQISQSIDRLWADNGSHAFIHHLNALFGYQPFEIRF